MLIEIKKYSKKIPENVVDIAQKFIDFNKQQKDKWIKTLTCKQMLWRLPIAVAQTIHIKIY